MPKEKRGITGDAASRRERCVNVKEVAETEEERRRRCNYGTTWPGQKRKKQKNQVIADCQTWHYVGGRGKSEETEEQKK
ncbi:hypothetical protein AVEN_81086-1 [Araneus ventricosus]|uniref:Uncharacterized protein n=1 Tax=Araneus ventricosus TaxID=182803 RepID=A0A4Y2JSN6_ARAVE|nr:hypothetical protein AVEN_81086-1 [Araneus ventricosus]